MQTRVTIGVLILALAGFAGWQAAQVRALHASLNQMQLSLADVQQQLSRVARTASTTAASTTALEHSTTALAQKTQSAMQSNSQTLQNAVARVAPAVVSIVESKEVPKLQVTYENPFGNNPAFQGFGMEVPVYQQVGTTSQEVSAGTGFFVRSNGYIITNKHVVPDKNATYTVLLSNGTQKVGDVIWRSPTQDLAVVKISGSGYETVPLGNSKDLALAQPVFAIGNALGQYSNSVSTGVVSGLNRNITASNDTGTARETLNGVIQTDAPINPGNSGGPLVNLHGQAVGITVALAKGSQNIGFAIPINQVKAALANLGI